ncbi:MAG: hypothetical protein LBL34_04630 [Clostridiales bacterium]|jgi:hypothetical protein|nr:hypothetical protein [Clostridiales bacterium]
MKIGNKYFILGYRILAFIIITLGILATAQVFTGKINFYVFFAYTMQSNILVWLFFAVLIVKTAARIAQRQEAKDENYGFYPVISFAICFAILVTMLIFWGLLAPARWGNSHLLTFANLGVHLFCPLLMIGDRLLFYKKGMLKKHEPLAMVIFPFLYIIQALSLGMTRAVYFEPLGIKSYYIYFFLDFDIYGYRVFLFIFLLTVFFLALGYGCYYLGKRMSKPRKLK